MKPAKGVVATWPPNGVPIEIRDGKQWWTVVSAGAGKFYPPSALWMLFGTPLPVGIDLYDAWRYLVVDWKRTEPAIVLQVIWANGTRSLYTERQDQHIDWESEVRAGRVLDVQRRPDGD